ncbi:MAG: Rne/Rng family ribonuclease [Flavobacteriaceae bacterium]|jgi:ribonuclease G|nr:Rne/Rng family ribonuclease [Flavobacteriaceae bacterium]MDP4674970.1 Rne/Rng family ribonuclease [Flavobacteriaceae bacterium]MDP4755212.1 Rne/Rng family ribonuclease [Flavobacteriaceae bacterium]MDP4795163.1 Rne/Rng family ribonuclease [Flavobacteriaceae bacterium]MDP4886142.1 Rne/Rng family ribonuclease [Flavobacteriaceae bacterium]
MATKELVIRSNSDTVDFALLKEGRLVELHTEKESDNFAVGDIFIAKVRKPITGLNAAFVNVGYEKDAFLHYQDLGPQLSTMLKFVKEVSTGKSRDYLLKKFPLEPDIEKEGSINDALKANQSMLVQIVKEPISTKGPRISSEISIAGRYLVMVPFSNRVSVSQKIESREERDRLTKLVKSIKPKGFGVIIRTVAEGTKVAELDKDLQNLLQKWTGMCKKLYKAPHPSKVLVELNRAASILRDLFNDSFTGIHVNDETMYSEIKEYVQEIAPEKESIVQLHTDPSPIFEKFGIERQIKTSFGRTATMKKGAYLVIEHTEALHVIDVNSGNRSNKAKTQEDTALQVNLASASEVARQLRLRDMGGIIVVDFIDMADPDHRRQLYEHLKEEMSEDRAKHKILPPSKFGLVQITRQRVRPEMNIKTSEPAPTVTGKEVEAPIVLIDKITGDLERLLQSGTKDKVVLHLHPFIAAYLTIGWPSIRMRWWLEHKRWVRIEPRDAYRYLEYRFKNPEGKTIY